MRFSPDSFISFMWIFQMAVESLLLCCVLRNKKGWTAFLAYLLSHLLWSVLLFEIYRMHRPKLYFYFYWWGRGALFVMECTAVASILWRIVAPIITWSRPVIYGLFVAGLLTSAFGWYASNRVSTQRTLPITKFVLSAERGLTTIEALTILLFVGFISIAALRWSHTEAFVTSGFISQSLFTMLASALFAFCPARYNYLIQSGLQVAGLIPFAFWLVAFYPILQRTSPKSFGHVA